MKELSALYQRDLEKLAQEIALYPSDELLWQIIPGIINPGGNLAIHLCGNLREFIGRQLGEIPYTRNRAYEFSATGRSKSELLDEINTTKKAVHDTLTGLDPSRLEETYPQEVFGYPMNIHYFLLHLLAHLSYHLGQVNYHRRIITAEEAH
ncbi:MAG TPA: DinB family protein [Saprospiraceae bacterium]|nr:DinB family protein [Saprospiraceae bacterium]MCB9271164.1 DinB family protein [Lewinellaceae bacterium]HPG09474.1 DinB family protein [Saprospiraceae bacterium]HPQ99441.1 DinB family protein [Saprospiraceae bacterium]HQU53412.1 DinB family protein [Saprospiraceae bacterium]